MALNVGNLVATLSLDKKGFDTGITGRGEEWTEGFAGGVSDKLSSLSPTLATMGEKVKGATSGIASKLSSLSPQRSPRSATSSKGRYGRDIFGALLTRSPHRGGEGQTHRSRPQRFGVEDEDPCRPDRRRWRRQSPVSEPQPSSPQITSTKRQRDPGWVGCDRVEDLKPSTI